MDDDHDIFVALKMCLHSVGWECIWFSYEVSNPGEIIACDPLVALVDLHLRAGDGLDLARQLKAAGCGFPIILMTADIGAAADIRAGALEVDYVLEKPFSVRAFGCFLADLQQSQAEPGRAY